MIISLNHYKFMQWAYKECISLNKFLGNRNISLLSFQGKNTFIIKKNNAEIRTKKNVAKSEQNKFYDILK